MYSHSIAGPWVLISSQMTHMVYLLPFKIIYLAPTAFPHAYQPCPTQARWQISPTSLEAIASSNGKKTGCLQKANGVLKSSFPKLKTIWKSVESLLRNRDQKLTENWHVYASFCRPEVAGDIISSWNVKTIDGYTVANIEASSFSTIRDILKKSCRDSAGGGGHWREHYAKN